MRGSTASELSNGRPSPSRHAVCLTPAVAANSLNRTVFCFGYIIGASPLNPNAWTTDKLRAAITEVKTKYPEIAGVMMCKSHRVTVLTLAQISDEASIGCRWPRAEQRVCQRDEPLDARDEQSDD